MMNFKNLGRKAVYLTLVSIMVTAQGCNSKKTGQSDFYTEADSQKISKIDAHCHIYTKRPVFMEQAIADNFRILTINVDHASAPFVDEEQEIAIYQCKAFPNNLKYLSTFKMEGFNNDDWQEKTLDYLKESFKKGAIGIKVWKNIGMVEKDKNGKFIMIDDPKFDLLFNYLEEKDIPVCGHLSEPRNCWLPIDSMTVNNDRQYFKEHPQYYMYLHPEVPSYEKQIAARDRLLEKHPKLKFMGAHLGSLEWSVEELAKHFDKYPNLTVDMAARTCHLEKQAQADWQKVHDFFIKYQDRIIYGTDLSDSGAEPDPEKQKQHAHDVWIRDLKFLTSGETLTTWEINGEFNGMKLPKEVVDKIYYKNAVRVFPEFKKL